MRHVTSMCTVLLALGAFVGAHRTSAQATTVALTPQVMTIERQPDGSPVQPAIATLQIGHTDPRSNCAKVARVAVMKVIGAIPLIVGVRDLPNGAVCSWNASALSMQIEPFKGFELPACGSVASVPLVIALMGPKPPTLLSSAFDQVNSMVNTALGGSSQGSSTQYVTVDTRNATAQAHIDCSQTNNGFASGGSSGAPVHGAHPVGSSSGTSSSGSAVHSASPVSGSPSSPAGAAVHAALPAAALSLSVPQYSGVCPATLTAQASYRPPTAGTATVVWKFGDAAASTTEMPVTAGNNTISLAQHVTGSRNTTLTLTVTTGGVTSTQMTGYVIHCD